MTTDQTFQHRRDLVVETVVLADTINNHADKLRDENIPAAIIIELHLIADRIEDLAGELGKMPGYHAWVAQHLAKDRS